MAEADIPARISRGPFEHAASVRDRSARVVVRDAQGRCVAHAPIVPRRPRGRLRDEGRIRVQRVVRGLSSKVHRSWIVSGFLFGALPGYSQFGDHFMNPLLVEAHAGVTAVDAGVGVDGIALRAASASSRGARRFKKGCSHGSAAGHGPSGLSRKAGADTGERLSQAGLPLTAVVAMKNKGNQARRFAEQLHAEFLARL